MQDPKLVSRRDSGDIIGGYRIVGYLVQAGNLGDIIESLDGLHSIVSLF